MGLFNRKKPEKNLGEKADDITKSVKAMAESCHDRRAIFINIIAVPQPDGSIENSCLIVGEEKSVEHVFLQAALQNHDFSKVIKNVAKKLNTGSSKRRKIEDFIGGLPDNVSVASVDMTDGTADIPDDLPDEVKDAIRGIVGNLGGSGGSKTEDDSGFNDDLTEFDD